MIISVINLTNGELEDRQIQPVIRAINRQITEDFYPYWSLGATLRLEGHSGSRPREQSASDMRGDAVIYIWNKSNDPDTIGYHDENNKGIPYGFVFLNIAKESGEDWSITLSHEALELIADPEANLLVAGPHPDPKQKGRKVFHWYEMCDAVQADFYPIDGINVSNFVLPLYFTSSNEKNGRNDFLGSKLKSFGVNPGGYVGFYDPKTHRSPTYEADNKAKKMLKIKSKIKDSARRAARYKKSTT